MKKSKVLKRSLSLLLAMLLVVAMIPFGASAADPTNPLLAELRVGTEGNLAEINQTTKTITATMKPSNNFTSVRLQYTAKDGNGALYLGEGYEEVTAAGSFHDLTPYKVSGVDGSITIKVRIQDPVNGGFYTDYLLTVQNVEVSDNLSIKNFTINGQVGSTFETGKLSFEILMPYNRVLNGASGNELVTNILLADSNANHNWVDPTASPPKDNNAENLEPVWPDYDRSVLYFNVSGAQTGETQEYEVVIRRAEAVTSFDIPNQTENQIKWPTTLSTSFDPYKGEDVMTGGEINIKIPKYAYTTTYLSSVVPTFTSELGDVQPTKIELYNSTAPGTLTNLTTGVTKVDLTPAYQNNAVLYIVATYPANTGGAKAVYALHIDEEADGSRALIVDGSVESETVSGMISGADITDDTINFNVSESMNLSDVDLKLTAPAEATVSFTIGTQVYSSVVGGTSEYGTLNWRHVDLRKDVTVLVESGTGVKKTYTLKTTPVETPGQDAKFKSVYLKNNKTGVVYEADADLLKGVNITFTVPRSTQVSSLDGFTLYYSAPLGASITYKDSATTYATLPKSGSVIDSTSSSPLYFESVPTPPAVFQGIGVLPRPDYERADTTEITVRTYDDNGGLFGTTNYIVGFKYNPWLTDNKIKSGEFALTSARAVGEVSADNTYTGTVKTVNGANTVYGDPVGNYSVLEVSIPWVNYAKMDTLKPEPMTILTLKTLGISEHAALYVQTSPSTNAVRFYPIGDDKWATTQRLDIDNVFNTTSLTATEVRIFVLNEKGVYDLDPNGLDSISSLQLTDSQNAGNVTQYYLVTKPEAKRASPNMTAATIINSKDQTRAVTVSTNSVVFNIPWSWATGNDDLLSTGRDDPDAEKLHLSYTANAGNLLYETQSSAMIYSGGYKTADGTEYESLTNGDVYFKVSKTGKLYVFYYNGSANVIREAQSFYVEAENDAAKSYTYTVNVLPIQSGAEISSFSINGVAGKVGTDTITVELPFGSKYDDVAPVFTVSDMATVTFDETGVEVISGVTELDFTKTVNLTVNSEDRKSSTKYKVVVTAPMRFSDVKEGSWYYDAVMEAAGLGIVNGYSDGTFKPGNPVTRADFVLMLSRAMGVTDEDLAKYTNNPFMDVDIDSYYAKAVAWAADNEYVTGYDNADFKPSKNITRQEAATIYCRVMGLAEVTNPSDSVKYKDHGAIASWAVGYVYAVQNEGIMSGHSDGRFTPQTNLTRAQTAQAMVNYYHIK